MRIVKFILFGIFTLFFQIFIAPKFEILRIIPNFLIAYIIFISMNQKYKIALAFAFFFGLAFDLMYPLTLGLNAFTFIIISFLVNRNHKSINKEKLTVVLICIFAICFIYYLFFFINYLFAPEINIKLFSSNLFSIIYNMIITFFVLYIFLFIDKIRLYLDV